MDFDFLDAIYDSCMDYAGHANLKTENEIKFIKEYINPLHGEISEEKSKMADTFSSALAESERQGFRKGFKSCMKLMMDCFSDRR